MDADVVLRIWVLSLVIFAVVVIAVVILLALVVHEARAVRRVVGDIWTVGQKIANNTIHIALLRNANHTLREVAEKANSVADATTALRTHTAGGPR